METLEFCRAAMNTAMKDAGLNYSSWAEAAGVSESGVRGFLSGRAPNISLEYLEKLARVVGKTPMDFLPSPISPADQETINDLKKLDEADKELIRQNIARFAKDKAQP